MTVQISRKFPDGTIIMITTESVEEFEDQLASFQRTLDDYALPYRFDAEAQLSTAFQPAPGNSAPGYNDPVPQDMLPPELANTGVEYFIETYDRVDVKTDLGNIERVTVEFYNDGAGLEWPVGAMKNWRVENAEKVAGGLGLDFSGSKRYNISGRVFLTQGKAKKSGNGFYKDVRFAERTV